MKNITLCRLPHNSILGIKQSAYPLWAGYLAASIDDYITDSIINLNFVDGETFKYNKGLIISNNFINKALYAFFPRSIVDFNKLRELAFNENDLKWNLFIKNVLKNDPLLIAVSAYTNQLASLRTFAKIIKRELPECKILLGGIHVTVDYVNLVNLIPEIDYYCIGEGEQTFRGTIQSIIEDKDIGEVPGIYSPRQPEKYRARELIKNLDLIKPPNRNLAPRNLYRDEFHIFSSRGCPFRCNFCSSHRLWSRKIRYHSETRILSELDFIIGKLKGFRIIFVDDTFPLDRNRVFSIMDAIVERGYSNLNIHIGARIDTVDEKMLDSFAKSGVRSISFGIETGSSRIQKVSGKNLDRKKIIDTLHYARSIGIHTLTYYIVGHPDETEEDAEATIELMKLAGATKASVCAMQPLPGTEIAQRASEKGFAIGLKNSLYMDQLNVPIVNLTKMPDQVLKEKVFKAYKIANQISQRGRLNQAFSYYLGKFRKSYLARRIHKTFGIGV